MFGIFYISTHEKVALLIECLIRIKNMKASLTELEVSSWFEIGKEIRILFLRKHFDKILFCSQ